MGTTTDKLAYLSATKDDIRAAMIDRGLSVPTSTTFREYGDLIRTLPEKPPAKAALNSMSWANIRKVSEAGLGPSYWAVGDTKSILVKGTVGTLSVNQTLWVYIIGFDHNPSLEGRGIHFGTFKAAQSSTELSDNIALVDSQYGKNSTTTTKYFSMNHGTNTAEGGWKGCDLRYDILGSTKTKGADAASNTATSPVSNTLMAALPSDLRAVMQPMTKYTFNDAASSVYTASATIDYLPLLSEWEVYGVQDYAFGDESQYQRQYEYFAAGNYPVKYQHSSQASRAQSWYRSPLTGTYSFCCSDDNSTGVAYRDQAHKSLGIAPIFKV